MSIEFREYLMSRRFETIDQIKYRLNYELRWIYTGQWLLLCAACFVLGATVFNSGWKQEMRDRGLMEYNAKTGALEWTDKAGGKDFKPESKESNHP